MHAHYLPWKMNISLKEPSLRHNFRFVPRHSHNNSWMYQILDPGGHVLSIWNRVFLVFCLLALFVDPLYFYLPKVGSAGCMKIDNNLFWSVLVLRSVADLFYMMHMFLKFRTAYILPGSRAIAKGELVMDPHQIAMHYLKSDFIIDFAAMLPLPQIMNWIVIPNSGAKGTENANNTLSLIVFIQYVPRLFLIFPLNRRIIKNTGVVTKTAWAGAAYNLLLYMLASHVLGASWYLMSIQRQRDCWSMECENELNATVPCLQGYLDCKNVKNEHRRAWLKVTKVIRNCDVANEDSQFDYGIFADALTSKVVYEDFIEVFLYCLWWGLKNLSSYGQNLSTSRYVPEQAFCILICIGGLILFCHLIGNIQTYLQSLTVRLEEWRVKKRDTEEWMRHRQLPEDLQERVRKFVQYKWLATRGVDEDVILRGLPLDLRRDIQRHLCLALVRRVPFFSQMDNLLLDAICERLVSSLSTEDTYIVREGDPVDEMLFIIRGQLESSTTNGGRSGFFNSIILRPGDFCGEELLTWALVPNPSQNLPTSTRTVKALCEVEAFALRANDLKYVSNQFKLLHSKKLQHVFRYYSHQWRTWGACLIQAAWRRFKKRKLMEELERHESLCYYYHDDEEGIVDVDVSGEGTSADTLNQQGHLGATVLASKFAANTRRGAQKQVKVLAPDEVSRVEMPKLLKPDDPYVSMEGDLG